MQIRRHLLTSVSTVVFALSPAMSFASVAPALVTAPPPRIATEIDVGRDPLVNLIERLGDDLSLPAVRNALLAQYPALTLDQARRLPGVIAGLRGLGVPRDVTVGAAETMAVLLGNSPAIPAQDRQSIARAIAVALTTQGPVMVAQECAPPEDPNVVLDENCVAIGFKVPPGTETGDDETPAGNEDSGGSGGGTY